MKNTYAYISCESSFFALHHCNYRLWIGSALLILCLNGKINGQIQTSSYGANLNSVGGEENCGFGYNALDLVTQGEANTGFGTRALYSNVSGHGNTAIGYRALYSNAVSYNTATGYMAMYTNASGLRNVANGYKALYFNTTGSSNVATGYLALYTNTGELNTAVGTQALYSNTVWGGNTAIGYHALYDNNTGSENTAVGYSALSNVTDGWNNSALGGYALLTVGTGFWNLGCGRNCNVSLENLNHATAIGYNAIVNDFDKIRLGSASVTRIEGPVAYTDISDGRFKFNITENDVKGVEFIKRLRAVNYNFDTKKFQAHLTSKMTESVRSQHMEEDFGPSSAIRHTGFIAQEVEKAANEAGYDFSGIVKPRNETGNYALAYSHFVVPLVKAVQEQQLRLESQTKEINELKTQIAALMQNTNGTSAGTNTNGQ